MVRRSILPLIALAIATGATPLTAAPEQAVPAATPTTRQPALVTPIVVHRFPHDREAFTEGLVWDGAALIESVGLEGRSDVRRVDLTTGKVRLRRTIPAAQFGEGLALWKGQAISLTWHDGIAHRWTAATLKPVGTMSYSGEGWGLTSDATSLIRSDGSSTIFFHDPATMKVRRTITVTFAGRPLDQINELEIVDGAILANVWHQPFIVRIDPRSGAVTRVIDLRAIVAEVGARDPEAVANGIAWDAKARRLFVTGKRWPTMFEIRLPK